MGVPEVLMGLPEVHDGRTSGILLAYLRYIMRVRDVYDGRTRGMCWPYLR